MSGGPVVQQELGCLCGGDAPYAACCDTLSTYDIAAKCQSFIGLQRRTGCGKVTYHGTWGFGMEEETFDAASGALVGVVRSGDSAWGTCNVHTYSYGELNEACPTFERCNVCGRVNLDNAPACN